MLNYEFPPLGGGAGNACYYLLKEFSHDNDLTVDLVTSSVGKFKKEKFSQNITIHYLDIQKKGSLHYQSNKDIAMYYFKAYGYCKKLVIANKYDIAHAFFGFPSGYIAMKLGLTYIVSLRGSDVPFYNKRFYWLDKFIFKRLSKKIWKRSKATIANSQGLKQMALKNSPKQKISVIYNGIDIKEFKPEDKTKNKRLTIISTGRLIQRKGYQYLIPALKNLDVKLQLIGDGNLDDELKKLARQNNIDVDFLGKKLHKDIAKHLQKADVFCLPSLNEGMSNSVLEAMACGLPVIVTDVGGSRELVNENGFVVKKASVSALRKAIERFLNRPELVKEMGLKSRKIAEGMSWKSASKQYRRMYELA
jgi:L-malate glycosyltransferase